MQLQVLLNFHEFLSFCNFQINCHLNHTQEIWIYKTKNCVDSSTKPKILQEIDLTQRNDAKCEEIHAAATWDDYDFYQQGLICAGGDSDGGKDGCPGDSGSPLMVKNAAKNHVIQVGLMSGSPGEYECGSPNITSYYTRVSYYLKWILDNIYE